MKVPSTHDVHMQMIDGLPSPLSAVHNQAEAVTVNFQVFGKAIR